MPELTPKEVLAALKRAGFYVDRKKGSHITLKNKSNKKLRVTIPYHTKGLKRGTLYGIIRQSGLNRERFLKYLKGK